MSCVRAVCVQKRKSARSPFRHFIRTFSRSAQKRTMTLNVLDSLDEPININLVNFINFDSFDRLQLNSAIRFAFVQSADEVICVF